MKLIPAPEHPIENWMLRQTSGERRNLVWSKLRGFLILSIVGCIWFAVFLGLSHNFSVSAAPAESEETKNVRSHFVLLAAKQRSLLDLEKYYGARHLPGTVDAIVEFTQKSPIQPRSLSVVGFLTKHLDIAQGEDGTVRVSAVFTRRAPYTWPRSLDLSFGPDDSQRVDMVDGYSSADVGFYRINSDLTLDMKSPNGKFAWEVTKDKVLMTSPKCLYRQDLYKDGEWIKSLVAMSTEDP